MFGKIITQVGNPERSHQNDFPQLESLFRYKSASEYIDGEDNSILDVACGEGYGLNLLYKKSHQLIGIDYSKDSAVLARKNLALKGHVYLAVMNACYLGLQEDKFDIVCAFEIFEHLKNPEKMLEEMSRVLKKKKRLILSTPNKLYWDKLSYIRSPFHIREYAAEELRQILTKYFEIEYFLGMFLRFKRLEEVPLFAIYWKVKQWLGLGGWMLSGRIRGKLFGGLKKDDFYLSSNNLENCSYFFVVCNKRQ
jgi:SAM-dependent methyltransferase